MNVKQYLDSKNIHYRLENRPSGEQAIFECPACGNSESFAINTQTGAFNCMRKNNCGVAGNYYQFQKLMGDEPAYRPAMSFLGEKKKEYKKIYLEKLYEPEGAWAKWLTETRAIPDDIVKKYRLHISKDGKLGFVYRNLNDEIVNIKWRTKDKKFHQEKDAEPSLYGKDVVPKNSKELIICEGEMDCLSWSAYKYNAVSIPSGASDTRWIENDWEWLGQFKTIYISMDMDSAGQSQVQKIAVRLGLWRTKSIKLPHKDANECLVKKVPADKILESILTAFEFKIPEIKRSDEYIDEIIAIYRDPSVLDGYHTGFKQLDNYIRGWRMGELTVWTGKNGTGKTTLLNQISMLSIIHHDLKVGIVSLEMLPRNLLIWMAKQSGAYIGENQIRQFFQMNRENMFIVDKQDEMTAEELNEIMTYGSKKYGINVWFIDSLIKIAMYGNNELQLQRKLMNGLTSFARENMCHIHLVAHPRKAQAYHKGLLSKDDVGGSGVITDLAHNVIILHRVEGDEKQTIERELGYTDVHLIANVAKNREHGILGSAYFTFDRESKKYSESRKGGTFTNANNYQQKRQYSGTPHTKPKTPEPEIPDDIF